MTDEDWRKEWRERLVEWLEKEELGSPLVVDRSWDTEILEDDSILARSYSTPLNISIELIEKDHSRFLDMTIQTPVGTAMLEEDRKRYLYQTMLRLNNDSQLMKFGLEGIDDEIVIEADFALASINRKEFDDGLRSLLEGATLLFTRFIPQDTLEKYIDEGDWSDYEFYYVMEKLVNDLKNDEITKQTAVGRLKDIGYDEEQAEDLVGKLEEMIKEEQNNLVDPPRFGGAYQ